MTMTNNEKKKKIVIIKKMTPFLVLIRHLSQIILLTNKKILLEISHVVEEKCKPLQKLLKQENFPMLIITFGKIMVIRFKKRRVVKVSIINVQIVTR